MASKRKPTSCCRTNTTDAASALDAIPADLPGYDNFLAIVIAAKASGIDSETVRVWTEGASGRSGGQAQQTASMGRVILEWVDAERHRAGYSIPLCDAGRHG